jgi:hypothetical protein
MSRHRQEMPVLNAMTAPGRMVALPPQKLGGKIQAQPSREFVAGMGIDTDQVRRVWVGAIPDVRELIPENLVRRIRKRAEPRDDNGDDFGHRAVESLGPQRLPFPELWIEFAVPDSDTTMAPMAAYVGENDHGYGVVFFRLLPSGYISCTTLVEQVQTDDQGRVETMYAQWATEGQHAEISDEDNMAMIHVTLPVMWAVGLMNCRNVKTVEVTPQATKTKKQRRPRQAGVSYHTIVLPSIRQKADGSSEPVEPGSQPLHKVRGHFKTYTADAPLLGKHTGTYYWHYQVRGNRDNGEIVSDYRMIS